MSETLAHAASSRSRFAASELRGASLGSVGVALPETVVDNAQIAERLGLDDRWIVERTGIRQRHVIGADERLSDLAVAAGRAALEREGLDAADVDLVLVGTMSQDEITPNTAPLVAAELGAERAGAIDVGAACTAFLSAVGLATAQIESARADNVLVIGVDVLTRFTDPDDRQTAAIFGDGAGAVVMRPAEAPGNVGPVVLGADGHNGGLIVMTRADPLMRMDGPETFRHAVKRMTEVTGQSLAAAGLKQDDIDLFVYHQANHRILRAVGQRLDLPAERVVDCVARYGNTSAASIPIALAEAEAEGRLHDGARVLLAAFGAGFTWGGVVVEWSGNGA
ncbi:MAG: ketoacyl-ACP synthase III [Thermoleophilaceae bacterium]|nr:ketoacyl-ACP synthase III [Thermoleophilaceae bacterium]